MPASSKHKYSKTLAFPDTYYELIINLLQSVELFCACKATLNLRAGAGFDIYPQTKPSKTGILKGPALTTDPHKLWQTLKKFDYPIFFKGAGAPELSFA